MKRRLLLAAMVPAIVASLGFVRLRITPLWGLYVLERTGSPHEVLFLDPFPSAASCAAAARAVGTSGQWTRCRARLAVSFFQPARLLAFEKQFSPGGRWEHETILCGFTAGETRDVPR